MRSAASLFKLQSTRRELVLLLLASIACVLVLTVGIAGSTGAGPAGFEAGHLLLAALLAGGALLAVVIVARALSLTRRQARLARQEAQELRRNLATAEALIKAEPQILIYWEQGQPLRVVTHTLAGIPGLPGNQPELLRFGFWLEPKSANALKASLETLFAEGRAFNIIIKTVPGGHLEADGRAAGGRAVLRLRDVAGYRRDLGVILDHHTNLARDIRSSRALLDALPHPVWLKGADGRLAWVNAAYVKAVETGSETEVLSRQIELMESRQRRAADRTLKKGQTYRERIPLIVSGERKAHDVVILPLGDATAGAAIDVAAIEIAQDKLDRQIAAYDRTLDRVATGVAIFSPDRRLTFFNAAFHKLWRLDADWLKSGPSTGSILDRLRELGRLPEVVNYREWRDKILRAGVSGGEMEDWWHLPDGRIVHLVAEQRPDGGVTHLYEDKTERLGLESRYNELTRAQSETLDSLKEGVAVFGTDGRLKLFNSAFAAIWKLSRLALAEQPHIDEVIRDARVLCDDAAAWPSIREAVASFSAKRAQLEGQMLRPDNSVIDYATIPLPDGGTLLTFADVTVSKRYERALVERNEALEVADRLKSDFIGHVSYELRTPLTSIIGFNDLLLSPHVGPLNAKQREYLDDITSESKTLLAIIDDILDLTTIEAGALDLKPSHVDVRAVIDAAIADVRERAAKSRLTFDIGVADDAKDFIADPARARQVLSNLLSNAVGFSKPDGVILVSCWREAGYMVFSVEDQGVGIPKEQQPKVFDRFVSRSQGSGHRGAGLGLSLVKGIVDLHGGDMTLESEPGTGTRVTVRFPERGASRAKTESVPAHDAHLVTSQR